MKAEYGYVCGSKFRISKFRVTVSLMMRQTLVWPGQGSPYVTETSFVFITDSVMTHFLLHSLTSCVLDATRYLLDISFSFMFSNIILITCALSPPNNFHHTPSSVQQGHCGTFRKLLPFLKPKGQISWCAILTMAFHPQDERRSLFNHSKVQKSQSWASRAGHVAAAQVLSGSLE